MRIDILTLFPEMFEGVFEASIIKRAREDNVVDINLIDIRDFATDKHSITDDYPYGGGGGMVMIPAPVADAIEHALEDKSRDAETQVVYLSPQGKRYTQDMARALSHLEHLVLLCGRYEGVDERICDLYVDKEISIGDYVLSGGEIPAMVVVESIVRLLPGAIGNENSFRQDSFYSGILDFPHYTRPREFRGHTVPDVLLSGHHKEVEKWRRRKALERTFLRRPDLLKNADLSKDDKAFIEELKKRYPAKDTSSKE